MRKFSIFLTVLITSFVMALVGLVASPIASASENGNGSISATFPLGSSVLSDAQKAAIKKTVASSGSDVSFIVTGTAGKLPGISDRWVQRLAKKRAQAIKAYIVSLGVSKANVTTQTKTTEIGIVPKSTGSQPTPEPTPTVTAAAAAAGSSSGGGSGGSSGGGGTPALTCATGGTCIVGETGPGGGKVYYVHTATAGFDCGPTYTPTGSPTGGLCKYLEVAPNGWNTGTDPEKLYATGHPAGNSIADILDIPTEGTVVNNVSGIGLGYKNSEAIVNQGAVGSNDTTTAAKVSRAYTGGGKNDWYLPSVPELNLLCQWGNNITQNVGTVCTGTNGTMNTGTGLGAGFGTPDGWPYWSSAEHSSSNAWRQAFDATSQLNSQKRFTGLVRPIRAF